MATWSELWEESSCVRYWKTFKAMPPFSKLCDLSIFLTPLIVTWMACQDFEAGYWKWLMSSVALLNWLAVFMVVAKYLRGYHADLRGVQAAPAGKPPGLKSEKVWLVVYICMTTMMAFIGWMEYKHKPTQPFGETWSMTTLYLTMFIQSLSTYTRKRFWNVPLNGADRESQIA